MLAGRIRTPLHRAFVGKALLALEIELLALSAAVAALVEVLSHALCSPLHAATLRRPAAVVRNRRHIRDARDLQSYGVQRAHRRFTAGARALDAHLDILHAAFLRSAAGALGSDLRGEGRRLAGALESGVTGSGPGERVALPIGDRDDRVIERRVDMGDALGDVLLDFLARARGCRLLQLLARRRVSAGHRDSLGGLPGLNVEFDRRLARPLARARVGARALPPHRQPLAVAHTAVATEVHEPLDRHRNLAAQVAFDGEARHVLANALELRVVEVLDLARALHPCRRANRLRARAADAKDRREGDFGVLVVRDVDACYACHAEPEIIAGLTRCYQPWRCLCRGSEQMTRTTPLRRTILHLRQILFTEAMTFIAVSELCWSSFRPEGDAALAQVIGRHLHRHFVARQDADVVHSHLPGDERMDRVAVLQTHAESRVGQVLQHFALHLDDVFLGHQRTGRPPLKFALRNRLSYWCVM